MKLRSLAAACLGISLAVILIGCGGSSGGGQANVAPTGTITGQVADVNGIPVPNAKVSTGASSATSAVDGSFTVTASPGQRTVLHVEAEGFAEAFPVARVTAGQTTTLGVRLLPVGSSTLVTVASGDIVTVPGSTAQVSIPANGLVPQAGGATAGSVTVEVTPINPADNINLMPGDFTGVSAGGNEDPIESFGALQIDIRDATGARYNLGPAQTSTIRIPVGTLSADPPPATIPLFYFDDSDGLWKEDGTATLQGVAPDQYYEGVVTHFSTWNADRQWEAVFITGCVEDTGGQPVANVVVRADGVDYSGFDLDFTAADGTFRVAIRRGSEATLGATVFVPQTFFLAPLTNTITVGPSQVDISLPECLTQVFEIVNSSPLRQGSVDTAYATAFVAVGGKPALSWSVIAGELPNGLTLDASTGQLSGTPTASGTFDFTIRVRDGTSPQQTAEKPFTLTITANGVTPSGTLIITGAPFSVGETFVGELFGEPPSVDPENGTAAAAWLEQDGTAAHAELLFAFFNTVNGDIDAIFSAADGGEEGNAWGCFEFLDGECGATVDRAAGTITFVNVVLTDIVEPILPPITLNGTLTFPPF